MDANIKGFTVYRKNIKVACVVDSVWKTCQLLQQYIILFQCLYNSPAALPPLGHSHDAGTGCAIIM